MNEAKEIISEAAQIAIEQNVFSFLGDYREAVLKLSTTAIYELPKILSDIFISLGIQPHQLNRVFVASVVEKDAEGFRFYETVSLNRGQNTRLFHDIEEAKRWLSGQ